MLIENRFFLDNKFFNFKKWKVLLQYYTQVKLSEIELVVVMLVMHFSFINKKFVDPQILSDHSNFNVVEIEQILSDLQTKNLIKIEMQNSKLVMNLDLLFQRLFKLAIHDAMLKSDKYYQELTKLFSDELTTEECYKLSSLLKDVHDFDAIKNAFKKIERPVFFSDVLEVIVNYFTCQKTVFTDLNWLNI